jgi:hypothetical protein
MPSTPGVPGGALPFSGPLDLAAINAEFGLGTDLTLYHGVTWYYDGNLTTDVFSSRTLKISDFYGKRATDPAASGVYFANTAGSSSFTVPLYRNSIKIEVWGGGGSGGGGNGGSGSNGGDSSILGITVGGGIGGSAGSIPVPPPPLDTTTYGHGGQQITTYTGYYGGAGGYGWNGNGINGGPVGTGNPVVGSGDGGTVQICLVPWALIAMADGTFKEIQYVNVGDKVKSIDHNINKIIAISAPIVNTKLVGFNGLDYFATETHPFLTDKGWGTFNVELLKKSNLKEYQKIVDDNNGNDLISINETTKLAIKKFDEVDFVELTDIKFIEVNNFTVYRISVDGNNTYISENFISHNKPI